MKKMYLPHWFVQKLSDTTLLRLDVLSYDASGVFVQVDSATEKIMRMGWLGDPHAEQAGDAFGGGNPYAAKVCRDERTWEWLPGHAWDASGVCGRCARLRPVIVSRHPAAIEFIRGADPKFEDAPALASATPDDVRGRVVAGNLPLHLAACAAEVVAVEFDGPAPRGAEYVFGEMVAAGARLARYRVEAL